MRLQAGARDFTKGRPRSQVFPLDDCRKINSGPSNLPASAGSAYNSSMPNPDSITNLLKANNAGISAVKANKAFIAMGILIEKERPSSKYPDKIKKYKALTDEGLKYGENRENMTGDETTPYYFKDSFDELLARLQDHLKDA